MPFFMPFHGYIQAQHGLAWPISGPNGHPTPRGTGLMEQGQPSPIEGHCGAAHDPWEASHGVRVTAAWVAAVHPIWRLDRHERRA